jgi:hypothetical protein
MGNLLFEMALRLSKAVAALALGLILYLVLIGPLGVPSSPELVLLCWLSGAAFILLVETSPI